MRCSVVTLLCKQKFLSGTIDLMSCLYSVISLSRTPSLILYTRCSYVIDAMLEVYLMRTKSEFTMQKSENSCVSTGGAQQFASMREFTTFHCCNIVYLQHGGSSCCRQNDVAVIHEYQNWYSKKYMRFPDSGYSPCLLCLLLLFLSVLHSIPSVYIVSQCTYLFLLTSGA